MNNTPHPADELRAYYKLGKYSELIEACRDNLEHLRLQHEEAHPNVRSAIENLARAYYRAGNFDAAEIELLRAISSGSAEEKTSIETTAILLSDLAQVYLAGKREADAETAIRRSEGLLEQLSGAYPRVNAILLMHRATLLMRRSRLKEAEELFIRAKELVVQAYGVGHPYYGVLLDNLSDLFDRQLRVSQAERMIRKALQTYEATLGRESVEYAIALSKLGYLLAKQEQMTDALNSLNRSLELLMSICPPKHPYIGIVNQRIKDVETQIRRKNGRGEIESGAEPRER